MLLKLMFRATKSPCLNICFPISFTLKSQNGISSLGSVNFFFCFCLITRARGNCLTLPAQPTSLGRPTREVRGINGGHSCSLPHGCPLSTEGCLMKVVLGSSGGSKNTHCALSKPFSRYSQVAIVAHKKGHEFPWSGGEKMFPDEVDCGNDWRWICYLCIMTYTAPLTLGRSLQGQLSVTE